MGLGGSLALPGPTDGLYSEGRVPRFPIAIRPCLIRVSSVAKKGFLVAREIGPCRRFLRAGWIMEPVVREGHIKSLTVRNLILRQL